MTSSANRQNPIPATNTSATTAASYASAAGAPKKSAQAPLIAARSQSPVAVTGTSIPSAQNAKTGSPPVNGKLAVTPAVPVVRASHASHTANRSTSEHIRKSSVTMAASGPNSFAGNGGPVGVSKPGIQFGFGLPAMTHSTPQVGGSAPVPIPCGNPRIPSPAHSPSPIPQPSASGGRPPSGFQQPTGHMTFGSLSSDGEVSPLTNLSPPSAGLAGSECLYKCSSQQRHMRQNSVPSNSNAIAPQSGAHFRRESSHSVQSENHGPQNRGSFHPQGSRGRGSYHPHGNSYNNQIGFPPNNQFRNGSGQGRGMPPSFQPQPRSIPYPNSPQPTSRSPALVSSIPNTPNVASANMQPNMAIQTPPQFHYPPPMAPQHQNFGYHPPQIDQYGRPVSSIPFYNNLPYIGPPQTNTPAFGQQYAPPPFHNQGHSMSRTPSQPERPSSASHQSQTVIVTSTPQPQNAQPNSASKNFVKPGRKSAAIQIKNAAGEVVDTSSFKQPASPAPGGQQSKTPVISSTPTPPPKPPTPARVRTDSQATPKTAKEIQDELKEKIKQATQSTQATQVLTEHKYNDDHISSEKGQASVAHEATLSPKSNRDDVQVSATAGSSQDSTVSSQKIEETAFDYHRLVPKPAETESKLNKPIKSSEPDEDEIERMIREMEEADAKREMEEEQHRLRKEAERAAARMRDEEQSKTKAADEDRQLREQEREMERIEAEKEKRQQEAEASGNTMSVADALAQLRSDRSSDSSNMNSDTTKLADVSVEIKKQITAVEVSNSKPATSEKRGCKPAALNLTSLNTKTVEPAQPSAALQSLNSARFLQVMDQEIYPPGIHSPNPALNAAVTKKGKTFKYDASFLLQFQKVFTEQPSLEFHQQVKSLIGDADGGRAGSRAQTPGSARQGSRGGPVFSMGTFAPPVRTLPPGTTSSERMAMASGMMPRPSVNSIGSFQRPGAPFPSATPMSRTSSQSNVRNMPNSPRQSSRPNRGSRRNEYNPKDSQAAKNMPLTAGQDIKPIMTSAGGWKPSSVCKTAQPGATLSGYLDPEMVQRKVKAALNKMTPEKFDRIADRILDIASQSKDESDGRTLRQVIQLTFEKATDEAHWASMYAKFCKRMLENMSLDVRDERIKDKNGNVVSGGNLFRKYLLNRCQEEFERGWTSKPIETKEAEENIEKKSGEAVMMSDEYYVAAAAKRRGLGLVQFIGELYKLGMLTERIMNECIQKLVDYNGVPDEAEIESLCKLLRTIGANLDQSEKCRPMMDAYFQRILTMTEMPELPSRMKFMLMDVIDLRRSNWVSKEGNKGPKTLEEVRKEAEAAQAAKAQEAARSSQRGGGGRPPTGRGDARNFSAGYMQHTNNQVAMDDLRRLKGSASRTSSQNVTLGPTSMFSSRSNSGRRLGPGGSLGRPGEESGVSSRTGTPPTRDSTTNVNAFSLLANMETENPASPPSAGPSPSLAKAVPDSKKEND